MKKSGVIKNKLTQSEVITTIILILVGIAAVVLISNFIIHFVKTNLKGTECLDTTGQIRINIENGHTFFNSSKNLLHVNIERTVSDFNLSGIYVIFGNEYSTKKVKITRGTENPEVGYVNQTGGLSSNVVIPDSGESSSYVINVTSYGITPINTLSISPILEQGEECGEVDKKTISSV